MLELISREQRELRYKQDARLRALLRLAGATLTIFLTTGTVAIAVSDHLATVSAIIVFSVAFLLVLFMIPIDGRANGWREGPDVDELLEHFHHGGRRPEQLQLVLVVASRGDYDHNSRALARIRALVTVQVFIAIGGIAALVGGLLAIA